MTSTTSSTDSNFERIDAIAKAIYEYEYANNPSRDQTMLPRYEDLQPYITEYGTKIDQRDTMRTMASVVERVMDEFPDINEEARVATIAGAMSDFYHPVDELFYKYPQEQWDAIISLAPKLEGFTPFEYSTDDNKRRFMKFAEIGLEVYRGFDNRSNMTPTIRRQIEVDKR